MKIAYLSALSDHDPKNLPWTTIMKPLALMARAHQEAGHDCRFFFIGNEEFRATVKNIPFICSRADALSLAIAKILSRSQPPAMLLSSTSLLNEIISFNPDIVHLHSFLYPRLANAVSLMAPTILQDHGGTPPNSLWKKTYFKRSFRRIRGAMATSPQRMSLWQKTILKHSMPTLLTTESPSWFEPNHGLKNRQKTDLRGNPIFLWIGHLTANKDPLTIIAGFNLIRAIEPEAALYFIYQKSDLLEPAKNLVLKLNLSKFVHFLGSKPHAEIESYLNSSDFYVLGTNPNKNPETWEVGGRSLSEALACGCIPLVADNPSFQWLTQNGRYGLSFRPGESLSMFQTYHQWKQKGPNISQFQKEIAQFHQNYRNFKSTSQTQAQFYGQIAKNNH